MTRFLLITAFGLGGVWLRYLVGLLYLRHLPGGFPYGTMTINIFGSFLIGIVYVLGVERSLIEPTLRVAIMAGLLGGFTTFSAMTLEAVRLMEQQMVATAFLYVGLSTSLGLMAAGGGLALARFILARIG